MYKIALKKQGKPCREHQRHLNPTLKEVTIEEIFKLLKASNIYPIANSECASAIHVLPKKICITIVKNDLGVLHVLEFKIGSKILGN